MGKDLLQRLDTLLDRIEAVFQDIRSKELSTPVAYRKAQSRLSQTSEDVLGKLGQTNRTLTSIELRVEEIVQELKRPGANVGSVKAELAQLETQAKQLETVGVDDVYTGELSSGKQLAKESKKDMLSRLDALFTKIDTAFAQMKK